MSFLGLGPRINMADTAEAHGRAGPRKKKKRRRPRKVRPSATAPADAEPHVSADQPDSADETSRVFIKRKPVAKNGEIFILFMSAWVL